MNSLCVVGSKLQLINAVSFVREQKDNDSFDLLVMARGGIAEAVYDYAKKNFRNDFVGIKKLKLQEFLIKKKPFSSVFKEVMTKEKIKKIAERLSNQYDYVLIGHNAPFGYALMADSFMSKGKRIIVVDDGIKTLLFLNNKQARDEEFENKCHFFSALGVLNIIYRKSQRYLLKAEFFTAFHEFNDSGCVESRKNSYKYFHRNACFETAQECHFVAQPLVSAGALSEKSYLSFLSRLAASFEVPLTYFPHPAEKNVEYLAYIEKLGFRIASIDVAYEEYYFNLDKKPDVVCSVYSSAVFLLSMSEATKTNFVYYDISESMVNSRYSSISSGFYELVSSYSEMVSVKRV